MCNLVFFIILVDELASVTPKAEAVSLDALPDTIYGLIKQQAKGLADALLQEMLPGVTPAQRIEAVNQLLQDGKIDLLKNANRLFYKIKESS